MARKPRAPQVITKMEALALNLLTEAGKDDAPMALRLDVFQQVGNWVKIKSKLEDDDGGAIGEYKRRLAGEDTQPRRTRRESGGQALAAFKSRLPAADDGSADGDSDDAGSEVPAAADGDGGLHPGLSGGAGPGDGPAGGNGHL